MPLKNNFNSTFHPDEEVNRVENQSWDFVITPQKGFLVLDLQSVWRYRDLVWMFFRRDFIAFYQQTVLGPLWYLIQPTLTALTYYMVFGRIANLSTNDLPPFLFYMSGIVIWGYFSTCFTNNSEIFSKNASLFGKVYFPRLVVPISVALSGMIAFAIQFALLMLVALVFWLTGSNFVMSSMVLLGAPLILLYVACLGMGVGLIISALTLRFRDLSFAAGFITQLWMYASPVVYPLQQIPKSYQYLFNFNPMAAPIETLRHIMFGAPPVTTMLWLSNLGITFILLTLGLYLFTRAESVAMDTV